VRLGVTDDEAIRRITARDYGQQLAHNLSHLKGVARLSETIYPHAAVVDTHGRSVSEVAAAVLAAVDWPPALKRQG
jgi:hypothetical protein